MLCCAFVKAPARQSEGAPARSRTATARTARTAPAPACDSLRTLYAYTDAVMRLAADGDTVAARAQLKRLLAADTAYAPAWYALAGTFLGERPDSAVMPAQRAAQADTANKWYLQRWAQALVLSQRYAEALPVYERLAAVNREPDDYRILALLYERSERPFSAIAILDSAESQFGSMPPLTDMKRRLLLSTRQYDKALAEALRSVETRPYDASNHVALGEIYEARGEDSLARASFVRAVQTDSSSTWAWVALGDYCVRHSYDDTHLSVMQHIFAAEDIELAEKVSMFETLTADVRFYRAHYAQLQGLAATLYALYPDSFEAADLYAMHHARSGNVSLAAEIYKHHLRSSSSPQLANYMRIASAEMALERPDSAERWLTLAVERFPDESDALVGCASFYYDTDPARAEQLFMQALRLSHDDRRRSVLWGYLGDLYHAQAAKHAKPEKYIKRSYDAYERALKYDAGNVSVLNNYAYFLSLERRSLERALSMSSRAVEAEPGNSTYLDTHGWVLYELGRWDEAKRFVRAALSLDTTGSPELRLHYGDILAALGETYMAEVYWRRAIEAGYADTAAIERRIAALKTAPEAASGRHK